MNIKDLFKSKERLAKEVIDEYLKSEDLFVQKFAENEEWRDKILSSLYSYVGTGVVWQKDSYETYINNYEYNAALYSIINIITREVKKIKWKLFEISSTDMQMKGDKFEVEDATHDILKLLNFRVNPLQSGSSFLAEVASWKLITGNSYIYMAGPGQDIDMMVEAVKADHIEAPKELWCMPAHITRINVGNVDNPINYYDILYQQAIKLPTARVIHIKDFTPDYSSPGSNLYGMSPLRAGLKTLTNLNDTYTAASKLLVNLGALGILFKDGDSDFSKENAEALSNQYERKTGPANIRKLLFAGAKLGYIKLSETANDLSLYSGARFSIQQLANIYGISTILLNDSDNSSTFANYSEAKKSLWTNVVLPLISEIRDELNYKLIPLFNKRDNKSYYIDMDLSEIPELKINLDTNSQVAAKSWWLTIGEKRKLLGYDDLDDESLNDTILVPNNIVPIEESSLNFMPTNTTNFEDDTEIQE